MEKDCRYARNSEARLDLRKCSRQCSHWAGRFIPARPSPEPEPMALQKVQPARESVPSRLGQLAPASRGIFWTLWPKRWRRWTVNVFHVCIKTGLSVG